MTAGYTILHAVSVSQCYQGALLGAATTSLVVQIKQDHILSQRLCHSEAKR